MRADGGEAILAALLEIIERDAVMLAWKCGLSLPLLDWSADAALSDLDRRFFSVTGLEFSVLDASCFLGVPVAISVLHGPPGAGAALAVGAAAAADVGDAWLKAIAESFGVYRWLRQRSAVEASQRSDRARLDRVVRRPHAVLRPEERAVLAAFPRRVGRAPRDVDDRAVSKARLRERRSTRSSHGSPTTAPRRTRST